MSVLEDAVPQACFQPPGSCANRHSGQAYWVLFAFIVLLGIVLRVAHWYPGYASDDSNYMNNAAQMARGEPPLVANNHAVRFAYQSLLAGSMRLFGFRTVVCQGVGIGVFVATAALLFLLVRQLSGSGQGVLAVAFYAILPLDMRLSTCVAPDALMTLLVLGSCVLYLHAKRQLGHARQFAMAVATGLVLGLAASAKEPAVFVGLGFAIHCVATMKESRRWFIVVGGIISGAIVLFALECIGFWLWTGDPLFRLHVTEATFGSDGWWKNSFSLRKSAYYFFYGANSLGEFGVHAYLLLAAALLAINRQNRAVVLPLLVCTILTVYLSVGSGSLTHYVLIPHQPRYFHVVIVLGCAIMGIEFLAMADALKLRRRSWVAAGIILLAVSIWATKEASWRGTVPVAEWLNGLDESTKRSLVVLETFGPRQALENRKAVFRLPTIPVRLVQRSADVFTNHVVPETIDRLPAGRGIVVDRYDWVTPPGKEDLQPFEQELAQYPGRLFRVEKIYGPSWPPYKRWLGVGAQRNMIGRIWWVESKD